MSRRAGPRQDAGDRGPAAAGVLIVAGSHADLIRREFRESLRQPSFWAAMAREAVPVVGVFFFGWEALYAGLFFVAESWIFMSTRASAEMAYDPREAREGTPLRRFFRFLGYLAGALFVYGLVLGILAFFAIAKIFPEEQWQDLLADSWREPSLLAGLGLLVATEAYRTRLFARGLAERDEAARRRDDLQLKGMYYRCFALLAMTVILGFLVRLLPQGQAFVLLIFLVMVYFEGCPRDLERVIRRSR